MGMISSIQNQNAQIIKPIDYSCDKTIEDEEPLKQIQQIPIQRNTEQQSSILIEKQNQLFPLESTGVKKWRKVVRIQSNSDIEAFTELHISSKGILKSPHSHPQSTKSDKKVSFKKVQIKEEKFFRSNCNKKHRVTLQDLEKIF